MSDCKSMVVRKINFMIFWWDVTGNGKIMIYVHHLYFLVSDSLIIVKYRSYVSSRLSIGFFVLKRSSF